MQQIWPIADGEETIHNNPLKANIATALRPTQPRGTWLFSLGML